MHHCHPAQKYPLPLSTFSFSSKTLPEVLLKYIVLSFIRFYWTPAPPKLHLSPTIIRNEMFPAYQGAPVFKVRSETEHDTVQGTADDSEDDGDSLDKLDPEDVEAKQRCVKF